MAKKKNEQFQELHKHFKKHVANVLKLYRVTNGYKQVDIAKILRVSTYQYGKYESGSNEIRIYMLFILAKHYKVHFIDFLPPETHVEEILDTFKINADALYIEKKSISKFEESLKTKANELLNKYKNK